ncbi:YgdI/YgdR family lipoprotein [Stutzerimonas kirkiae]|uniref:YgdI/YgdR family lipoprotein n=1 Tax=Stutzerimonas kirkiae TaxID=2211392 RepID=A0A4Q9R848_9GAMM|nr:YgdI/YgdR family lipoprotein [Stutzerimonas kirkiae]TBU96824.1 YgdI/YgdR family lipoprotein [Stutzerimonas kirkiae]TBV01063.1 YgdI/YgdR family lipoprotein [Stutzerimonas kirkiae]TBV08411.1 YgdI/YgdR family lipoprotein [Stutzerimonas kirkiae]TBV16678.1 YgdI/YgdR family lipoprotein [Stutzerimonas kirkiae]
MTKTALTATALLFGLLVGCATPSLIVLDDGSEIQTLDTPVYDRQSGFYEFEQPDGKLHRINKDRVQTIKQL